MTAAESIEGSDMNTNWTDWIIPTVVCAIFPVVIPMMLMGVLMLSVTSAMKTTPGDEI